MADNPAFALPNVHPSLPNVLLIGDSISIGYTLPVREQLDGISHALGLGIASYAQQAGYRGLVSLAGPEPENSGAGRRLVSQEEVDAVAALYFQQLADLFESYKADAGYPQHKLKLVTTTVEGSFTQRKKEH